MTTRKPKLNLLYVAETLAPRLQLAVVTTERNPSMQHARRWQSGRFDGTPRFLPPATPSRKH